MQDRGEYATRRGFLGMKTVRVGLIGCGNVSFRHAVQLAETESAHIVAAADPNDSSRTQFYDFTHPVLDKVLEDDPSLRDPIERARQDAQTAEYYESYAHMLESESLDAVIVESPNVFHRRHIGDALEAGVHVLTEKPMAVTGGEVRELLELAKTNGCLLGVAYHRHFVPVFRYMRDVIEHGGLGDIRNVSYLLCQNWYVYGQRSWRTDPGMAVAGHLMDSGSHILDASFWVTGLCAASVFAQTECFDLDVDVNATLTVNFSNGAIGDVTLIGHTSIPFNEDITIVGSEGAFLYRGGEFCHIDSAGNPIDMQLDEAVSNSDRNFVDAILGNERFDISGECALPVAELTDAALRSAGTGELVTVG